PSTDVIAELLTNEPVGAILDLDQPVDVAFGLKGQGVASTPIFAVAVAVKDADQAKYAFTGGRFKLVPVASGALRIEDTSKKPPRGEDEDQPEDEERSARHCEIGAAFGTAPVRLVCAESTVALDAFSSYLRRTATRSTATTDLHVELRTAPLKPFMKEQ